MGKSELRGGSIGCLKTSCQFRPGRLLPTRSRQNHPNRTARSATQLLPQATIVPLLGHSHHSIPTEAPEQLNNMLVGFLAN